MGFEWGPGWYFGCLERRWKSGLRGGVWEVVLVVDVRQSCLLGEAHSPAGEKRNCITKMQADGFIGDSRTIHQG